MFVQIAAALMDLRKGRPVNSAKASPCLTLCIHRAIDPPDLDCHLQKNAAATAGIAWKVGACPMSDPSIRAKLMRMNVLWDHL